MDPAELPAHLEKRVAVDVRVHRLGVDAGHHLGAPEGRRGDGRAQRARPPPTGLLEDELCPRPANLRGAPEATGPIATRTAPFLVSL